MKKKFVPIFALIIIICIFALCLSSCSSKGKVKYKEAIVYVNGYRYALRSYTIDDNGIMTIDAYRFINTYQTSIEWGQELQIITHASNVKIISAEETINY